MSISYDTFLNTLTVISVVGVILTRYVLKRLDKQPEMADEAKEIPRSDQDKLR